MKVFYSLIIIQVLFLNSVLSVNSFSKWTKTELTLDNGIIRRIIQLPAENGNLTTTTYKPVEGEFKYFLPSNTDFQFEINGLVYSGKSSWNLTGIKSISDSLQGDGASVSLVSADNKFELTLKYLMYPNLPVMRKSLVVKNLTA